MSQTVWIVSFSPFEDRASVGGFEWFLRQEEAERQYAQEVVDNGTTHVVRLVQRDVPTQDAQETRADWADRVTDGIDQDVSHLELEWPALREHVPGDLTEGT